MVKSIKPEGDFVKLSVEAGFIVFGTPVFFNKELHDEKNLQILWKVQIFPHTRMRIKN
jgi:hypothetical protein